MVTIKSAKVCKKVILPWNGYEWRRTRTPRHERDAMEEHSTTSGSELGAMTLILSEWVSGGRGIHSCLCLLQCVWVTLPCRSIWGQCHLSDDFRGTGDEQIIWWRIQFTFVWVTRIQGNGAVYRFNIEGQLL